MITDTPTLDTTLVNIILAGLLEREKPLDALAADAGMDLDDLLELLESPEMQAKIRRLQRALDQRAALLTAAAEAAAVGALTAIMEQARTDQARRQEILAERERAERQASEADRAKAVAASEARLADLDREFRKLVEAARGARAVLTHCKAKKPRPATHEPPPGQARPASSPARQ